jgi:hypothetical protein
MAIPLSGIAFGAAAFNAERVDADWVSLLPRLR